MPNSADVVPPGAPTVDSAGPALPAEAQKMTLCLCTISVASSMNLRVQGDQTDYSTGMTLIKTFPHSMHHQPHKCTITFINTTYHHERTWRTTLINTRLMCHHDCT